MNLPNCLTRSESTPEGMQLEALEHEGPRSLTPATGDFGCPLPSVFQLESDLVPCDVNVFPCAMHTLHWHV
jgi:hypothetical protein